jgi:UTP--glucose-1-phosphate uridylyltransferase
MVPRFDGPGPFVALDDDHFRRLADFERRFPYGAPSLVRCRSLRVEGDVSFGAGMAVEGEVTVRGPAHVADGAELRG